MLKAVVIVIVLSSGGATVFDGMEGTALGLLFGSFGGGFLPRFCLVEISTFDCNNSFKPEVFVPLCVSVLESLNDFKVFY